MESKALLELVNVFPVGTVEHMGAEELDAWREVFMTPGDDLAEPLERPLQGKQPFPRTWSSQSHSTGPDERTSWMVLCLAGKPQAGKDTVAAYLERTYAGVARLAFSDAIVDEVNEVLRKARARGLAGRRVVQEGNKNRYRRVLQDWGALRRRSHGEDYWVRRVTVKMMEVGAAGASVVVVMGARTPGDVVGMEGIGAAMWWVERPGNPVRAAHAIEDQLDHVPLGMWDGLLVNLEGSVEYLERQVLPLLGQRPRGFYKDFL